MAPSAQQLTDTLQAEAQRLGFSLFGVSLPGRPPHFDRYPAWIEAGRHAGMGYLSAPDALARRADPGLILPGVRAVLSLGLRYFSPAALTPPADGLPRGRVAAYAWGDDYHDALIPRLAALHDILARLTGAPAGFRAYTDTGALLERDLAQQAGLGWAGKHTCLINPRGGSYYLLAEVLTEQPLAPSLPETRDLCGSCTRCIDACPTACILPDRSIDAGRCISYLTIEHKGVIPPELRPAMGAWVFGCDICQMVCPWNLRFAAPEGDPAFAPRPDVPFPHLTAELTLTREAFNQKFKGSPLRRAKRRGYLRNVCIALGNQPEARERASPALADTLLHHDEPLVRGGAAWALARLGGAAADHALAAARAQETDPSVLQDLARS